MGNDMAGIYRRRAVTQSAAAHWLVASDRGRSSLREQRQHRKRDARAAGAVCTSPHAWHAHTRVSAELSGCISIDHLTTAVQPFSLQFLGGRIGGISLCFVNSRCDLPISQHTHDLLANMHLVRGPHNTTGCVRRKRKTTCEQPSNTGLMQPLLK